MGNRIQLKRGLEANRSTVIPADGELLVTLDQNKLYVGSASVAGGIAITSSYSTFSVSSSYTSYVPESASLWTSSYDVHTTVPSSSKEALDTMARLWYNTDHDLQRLESTLLGLGGVLTINNTGSINISSGSGYIVDQNPTVLDEVNRAPKPIIYEVSWGNLSNVIIPNTGSTQSTYIAIDYTGSVVKQNTLFTDVQRRDYIYLGKVIHRTGQITSVVNEGAIGTEPMSNFRDMAYTIGPINISGNVYSPSGSSLQLNKSSGETFRLMANYNTNYKSPNRLINPQQYQCNIYYAQRNAANDGIIIYSPSSSINPNQYDNGGGTLTTVTGTGGGSNRWTIQRIYLFPFTNTTYIFYGQAEYTTLADAKNGLATENFSFISADFVEASMFRGWLIVRKGETNLSSTDTIFLSAGKFGNIGSTPSAGGAISNFSDSTFSIYNASDASKQLLVNLSQMSTGATLSLSASAAIDGVSITFPSSSGRLLLETGSLYGTSSWSINSETASHVDFNNIAGKPTLISSSLQFTSSDDVIFRNITASNIILTGDITAYSLHVQEETSSRLYSSGSNVFGNLSTNTHQFTGSVLAPNITGSLLGTSSWSINSVSASYVIIAQTASYVEFNNVGNKPTLVSSSAQVSNFTTPVTASIISASSIIGTTLQGNGFNVLGVNYNSLVNTPSQLVANISTASLTDLIYYNNSFANVNGLMGNAAINPGFKLVSIVASSSAATTISVGTSPSDNSIVNSEVINTSMDEVPLGKQFFSPTVQTPLYISSPAWGGNSVNVICKFERVVGTISSSAALVPQVNTSRVSTDVTASNAQVILMQTTSGNRTIWLPGSLSNSQITIKKITNDSNTITIFPSGSNLVDSNASLTISYFNTAVTLVGDGTDWFII